MDKRGSPKLLEELGRKLRTPTFAPSLGWKRDYPSKKKKRRPKKKSLPWG